ncbi:MAG: hypothetical protein K0T99_04515 [Alphaproteobacteria bacterium]|nr:hypothetical protein [Alphaproteobacteria bacterium]
MNQKILICGKGKIASFALSEAKKILGQSWNIYYGFISHEQKNVNNEKIANNLSIKTFEIKDYNSFFNYVKELRPSLILFVQFSIIIRSELIQFMNGNIVNLHHGNLPKYRGMGPITHAILSGEKEFGVTLHFVDLQVDTGNIVKQHTFSIDDKNNEEVYKLCIKYDSKIITDFYQLIQHDFNIKSYPQDDANASYFSQDKLCYHNPLIDFNQSANQILCFCRAYFFPSNNLFPKIEITGKTYFCHSLPKIGERSAGIRFGTFVKDENDQVKISSRDRWLIFNNLTIKKKK